ncbi:prenyltransferase [Aquibacillus koreensis]|uniref:Prenyltransferase n=1 Tax=Aquibacillus koreensis TaxID=279446 RepID=A0A9X3WNA4_9BACI|nr:prenyltransferase [Aquibacillus koreensis]MCT2536084.1 prenyltransferase [Aquibacillus koreensis]MDC3422810.1 prenyltransferase [Aquibacillus koreensis]
MIPTQSTFSLKGIGMLLRLIAVVFSSVATILSTLLPLIFYYQISWLSFLETTSVLLVGAILIHGVLTHVLNDIADHQSGTDQYSPGILSGGSRVIQTNTMTVTRLKQLGTLMSAFLLLLAFLFTVFGYLEFAILTLVGIWGAVSYSLRPFQFAYIPFIGEWFCLFPTMLALAIALPWIMLAPIPVWAWQNSLINAVWCMAWVMFHHIPDRHADQKAKPMKRTSVVWAVERMGAKGTKFPVLLYFMIVGLLSIWIAWTRPVAALGVSIILIYAIRIVLRVNVENVEELTAVEKRLLYLALAIAIWLGIFV